MTWAELRDETETLQRETGNPLSVWECVGKTQ